MEHKTRRQLLLGALALVLAAAAIYWLWPSPSGPGAATSNPRAAAGAGRQAGGGGPVLDVHLDALNAARPTPAETERNLFRFKPKAPPAPPPTTRPVNPQPAPPPTGPAGTTGLAPIALKFFGVVAPPGKPKIAALSDGQGHTFYGREGDIIEGRYRIIRIGEESIEMAYPDGRGRQTIRLTGS